MKAEKIASLSFTVLSLAYIAGAFLIKEPPLRQQLGPEAFPFGIGIFMLVLSLIYVYQQFRGTAPKDDAEVEKRAAIIGADEKVEGRIDYKVVGIMLALMLFYAFTFEILGFPLVTFIVFVAGVLVLDRTHLKRDIIIALIASFGIFMLFRFVLRVNLPAGVLTFLFRSEGVMDIWNNVVLGFSIAITPFNLLLAFVGVFLGTVIGVLPGIGPMTGIALLIPITFGLPPSSAIILMAGIYYGAMYGGSTTSILVNAPGESSSVVTCIDGFEMAKKGRAGPALAAAAIGSFVAGTFATIMLMVLGPAIAQFALRFGPPEFFAVMLAGLTVVTSLAGRSLVKALLATSLGLAIATIGIDLQSGMSRYTFGNLEMLDGLEFLVVAIGLFALSEVIGNLADMKQAVMERLSIKGGLWLTKEDWKRAIPAFIRGTLSGFFVGGLAGAGAAVASFVSYGLEKRASKHKDELGHGAIEGIAGPESANNAAAGGAMIHLLCLGIPGSGTTAIMLGALLMLGLQPGPLLFHQQPEFVWGLIASMYIGNVMLLVLNLPLVGMWVKILDIPLYLLVMFIVLFSFLGVYTVNNSVQDLVLMVFFGIIGYLFRRLDIPTAPVILAMVLGDLMEQAMRQSLIISDGSLSIFVTRPISLTLLIIAAISITNPYWKHIAQFSRKIFVRQPA